MRSSTESTLHGSAWGAPPIPRKRRSPSPALQDVPKPVKRKLNLGDIFKAFGENTTAHGVPAITRSKRIVAKIFWLAVFITMLSLFCFQGTHVLIEYLGYPSTTKVKLEMAPYLNFPSVTICNMNRLRRSKLANTRFEGLIHLDGGMTGDDGTMDYSWFFDWDSVWLSEFMQEYNGGSGNQAGTTGAGFPMPPGSSDSQSNATEGLDTSSSNNQSTTSSSPSIAVASLTNGSATNQQTTSTPEMTPSTAQTTSSSTTATGIDLSTTLPQSETTQLSGSTAQIQSTSEGGGTGTMGRKKRSIRNIRDTRGGTAGTSLDTQENEIMDTGAEFGSWVQHEWNDGHGHVEHNKFEFHYEQFYDWGNMSDPNDWQEFYQRSQSPDYSDFLEMVNPSRAELRDLGHEAKDLIIQCTYDKKKCSYEDFHEFQNKEYGNCFTFNYGSKLLTNKTSHSGAQYGLHLTLFIEMPEYVGILSPEAGARVSIHPHNVPPFPEDDGITVAPGMSTNIGLRQVYIQRKGVPYNSKCHMVTSGLYSRKSCLKKCIQSEMFKRCQCVTDVLLENKTKCSYLNQTQQTCKQLIEYLGEEDRLDCSCPISCNETSYTKSVSASYWPSERYEEHLQRRLRESSSDAARMSANEQSTSKNLLRLRVYFEELNYQSIIESPLYTFPNLLGNVGGLLGLYIGVSFLTLCEVAILIFDVCRYIIKKAFCKNEISPSTLLLVEQVPPPEYRE